MFQKTINPCLSKYSYTDYIENRQFPLRQFFFEMWWWNKLRQTMYNIGCSNYWLTDFNGIVSQDGSSLKRAACCTLRTFIPIIKPHSTQSKPFEVLRFFVLFFTHANVWQHRFVGQFLPQNNISTKARTYVQNTLLKNFHLMYWYFKFQYLVVGMPNV